MSIKNIKDSLNTVNNTSANLEKIDENKENIASNLEKIDDLSSKLDNSIKLKNIKICYFIMKKNRLILKHIF